MIFNSIEKQILYALIQNNDYSRKVIPYLKSDYFKDADKVVFTSISEFITKYNKTPTFESLLIDIDSYGGLTEEEAKVSEEILLEWSKAEKAKIDEQWLLDQTETFCQDKAIYLAMMKSIEVMNQKDKSLSKGAIPGLLSEALAVSFDPNVGHDYLEDWEERYDFYHTTEERVPFDLEFLNKITKGGLCRKSLNIFLAGTGVGKTLMMCHMAAANLSMGKNVLYITMEMADKKIAERIDANRLNIALDDLEKLPRDMFAKKMADLKSKVKGGQIIIKEYPTASASAQNFRNLIQELRLKKNFVPDIIYIDYLNICSSFRMKKGAVNSYEYVKSIAEEIRGLAVEFDVPIVSATQTTRGGYDNSDVGLTDTSESFGLPATADFMVALIVTEELELLNQIMVKQLKNRYNDLNYYKRFIIGVDRSKMRLYDADAAAQKGIDDAGHTGKEPKTTQGSNKFKNLKVE